MPIPDPTQIGCGGWVPQELPREKIVDLISKSKSEPVYVPLAPEQVKALKGSVIPAAPYALGFGVRLNRQHIAERVNALVDRIDKLREKAIVEGGLEVTEIWLGPVEMSIFKQELDFQVKEEKVRAADFTGTREILFMGLTIRSMFNHGIRVGYTISE